MSSPVANGRRRKPIRTISPKRLVLQTERRKLMEREFGPRETWVCAIRDDTDARSVLGNCFGPIVGHELKKRSQGGSIIDPSNIVLLCSHHNISVEDHPRAAHRLGLVVRRGD